MFISFWRPRWRMMDEKRMIHVVLVLGFLSIGTDFGARVVRVYKQFVLLASLLEIIAAVALAIAHAIINARVPPRQLNVNWTEIAMIFGSWFTFAAASLCFLVSAVYDLGYFRDTVKPRYIFFTFVGLERLVIKCADNMVELDHSNAYSSTF